MRPVAAVLLQVSELPAPSFLHEGNGPARPVAHRGAVFCFLNCSGGQGGFDPLDDRGELIFLRPGPSRLELLRGEGFAARIPALGAALALFVGNITENDFEALAVESVQKTEQRLPWRTLAIAIEGEAIDGPSSVFEHEVKLLPRGHLNVSGDDWRATGSRERVGNLADIIRVFTHRSLESLERQGLLGLVAEQPVGILRAPFVEGPGVRLEGFRGARRGHDKGATPPKANEDKRQG